MKFNSKLWMLAVAMATVGCQDDLVDGGGTIGDIDGTKSTAKVNVAINTETVTKAVTKATPGEDGDGVNEAEVGEESEYKVNDVTLILYSKADDAQDWNIGTGSKLVAAGWTDQIGVMENSDATTGDTSFPNGKMTTVEVSVKDGTPSLVGDQATTYGVIAVTNLGKAAGEALAAKIAATDGYNSVADLDKQLFDNYSSENGHVMSTHDIEGSAGDSQVTFTPNSNAIPSTSVYVERLSAKIRLSEDADAEDFKYTVTSTMVASDGTSTAAKNDEIVLTNVAVVNQLSSGSFLLKRVSAEVENGTTELPTDNASSDIIIGDEKGSATAVATNYVIDPWTRAKTYPYPSDMPQYSVTTPATTLKYENQYTAGTFGNNTWSWTAIDATKLDAQGDLFLCYTQENTTGIAASRNGYSTGAVFKATYYPAQWMTLVTTGQDQGAVKAADVTYEVDDDTNAKTAEDFYTYTDEGHEYIFENYDAILGYIIAKAGVTNESKASITYYSFTKTGDALSTDFGANIAKLRNYADDDPFGYIEAMVAEYDKAQAATDENPVTPNYQAIDEYLKSFNPIGDDLTAFNERVKTYTDGVCYYPWWIKHAANAKDSGNGSTGVMEFGIVRNNIYDLTVSGISGLGKSEVDVTDPNTPDEDSSLKIMVRLYVKNWVLRSNDGIIL